MNSEVKEIYKAFDNAKFSLHVFKIAVTVLMVVYAATVITFYVLRQVKSEEEEKRNAREITNPTERYRNNAVEFAHRVLVGDNNSILPMVINLWIFAAYVLMAAPLIKPLVAFIINRQNPMCCR